MSERLSRNTRSARGESASPASTISTSSGHGPLGGDDADAIVLRRLDRRLRAGADHSDDRQLEELSRVVQRGCGCGVAGDDDELDVTRFEVPDDVDREPTHLVLVARAVREVQQVGDIDRRLEREPLADFLEYREPADTGVEDPNRALVAHAYR